MKARNKQAIALLMGLTLAVSCLAGCGEKTDTEGQKDSVATEEKSTETEQTASEEKEAADPFGKYEEEITLRAALRAVGVKYYSGNDDYDSAEKNLYTSLFHDELGINLEYDWIAQDDETYTTKWNMAIAQNNLPDFGIVAPDMYQQLRDADLIMDMTDVFEEYASDKYKEFMEADGGVARAYATQDERMIGLPFTGGSSDAVQVFNIRKDWLEALGLEVPTTIDGLIEVAQAFVDNKMGGDGTYGLVASSDILGSDLGLLGFFEGYGAYPRWIVDDSGELVWGMTSDENRDALLKLQEMYKNGLINTDFAVSDASITKEDVASGKVGIAYGTYWGAGGLSDSRSLNSDAEWVITEIPTVDGTPAVTSCGSGASWFVFVNKNCEHPEAVVKMLNLQVEKLYSEDSEVVTKYSTHAGPDGESVQVSLYSPVSGATNIPWQNLIRYQESTKALESGNEEFSLGLSASTYEKIRGYMDGDESYYNVWKIFGPEGTYAVIDKMKNEDRILLDAYQTFQTETMIDKKSILDDALKTEMVKVIMGEDISTYDKAVEEWYKNGGQIITDEANDWYELNH